MQNSKKPKSYLAISIFFCLTYFTAARLGLLLATINNSVSPVWPATGLAFGILFIYGFRFWPAIAIGAFSANILNKGSFASAAFITVGNTAQALVGAYLLHYFRQRSKIFGSYTRTLAIVVASLSGSCLSATVGTTALTFAGVMTWDLFKPVWFTWFTGDFLGGITILPLMLVFIKNQFDFEYYIKKTDINLFQFFSLILSGYYLCWLVFIRPEGMPFLFLIFPYLLWNAAVAGERGVAIATILISLFGIVSVQLGYGVFTQGSTNVNLINLQLFLGSVGISSLIISDLKRISSFKRPAIILLFSWLIAGIFFFGFYKRSILESEKRFEVIIDNVEQLLDARINLYFSALHAGTKIFDINDNITQSKWKESIDNEYYLNRLPGMEGIGIQFRVTKNDLEKAKINAETFSTTFFTPIKNNNSNIILNIFSESKTRMAAEIARDTGTPTISSKIFLIDDQKKRPTFVAYYPFFTKGPIPKSITERQRRIIGWVFTPIITKDFFDALFSIKNFKELSYSVSEINNGITTQITSGKDYKELTKSPPYRRTIIIGNHEYIINFIKSAAYFSMQDNFSSWAGVTVSILSLLLGIFIISIELVKMRALDLADKKTLDLKASEELWKFALEGAGDGVWDMNIPHKNIFVTKHFCEMLGYDDNELSTDISELLKLIHPEDLTKVKSDLKLHFNGNTNYVGELRLRCKNKSYKWILNRGMIVSRDQNHSPIRMIGTITDITSQKELVQEVENQRLKLHAIFEGTNDSILILNKMGEMLDCNTQSLNLFGFNLKSELIKLHPIDLSPKFQPDGLDSFSNLNNKIKRAFDLGINQFEWICKRISGDLFPAEILLTAFTYEGNRVLQATIRDISERKNSELSLQTQREKLMASSKMSSLGEMAGGIAHEINSPLAIIVGKTTQLRRRLINTSKNSDAKINEDLNLIENTAKRIGLIIKGLSAFSRNAENDSKADVLVQALIQDTLELSKERFKFNSIALKFDITNCQQLYVKGRASELLQVLINLLNNAFDAVENLSIKWVNITIESSTDKCKIMITDSGLGIPATIIEKIMTPFFTTKSVSRGTGLGLSISKSIIEDHKGKLYYDATSENTRFVIELPIANGEN